MKWLKNRARFYLSCKIFIHYVKIKGVQLKKLHTSACLNLNYCKNVAKMVQRIKTCDQYPREFDFGYFFSVTILPFFCWGKINFQKTFGELGNFLLPGVVMIRTWGIVLLGDMSKNEQIKFFFIQINFPVIVTPWIWNFLQPWWNIHVWEKVQEIY